MTKTKTQHGVHRRKRSKPKDFSRWEFGEHEMLHPPLRRFAMDTAALVVNELIDALWITPSHKRPMVLTVGFDEDWSALADFDLSSFAETEWIEWTDEKVVKGWARALRKWADQIEAELEDLRREDLA